MGRDVYSLIGNIVVWFLELWNRKRIVLPLLLLVTLASWILIGVVPRTYAFVLGSFFAAITITVVFLTFLLLGTIVIDSIEAGFIPLERVPRVVVGSLIAIFLVMGILLYLAFMLIGVASPPPLPFLLAILNAMTVTPIVTLAIVIPPTIGYFLIRERWRRLRARVPFWAVYLGLLAAFLCLYPILTLPQLWFIEWPKFFGTAGALALPSLFLLSYPREGAAKAVGLILPFIGFISWFTCFGGMTLGSILAILGGACAHSWSPSQRGG